MPNSLGRLPEDVLHHIGGLAFGASNPHVDELKKAAKRPMIKRVDEDAVYKFLKEAYDLGLFKGGWVGRPVLEVSLLEIGGHDDPPPRRDRRTRCRLPEEVSAVRLSPLEQDLRRTRARGVGRPRPSPAEGCPAPPESPRKWWCCRRVERATRPC